MMRLLSGSIWSGRGSPPIQSPYTETILSCLQPQQGKNSCGPFTLAMVINALSSEQVSGLDLARELNRPAWRGPIPLIRRIPDWATFPWGMVDELRKHGFQAAWRFLESPKELVPKIEAGEVLLPIIGGWFPPWSHVMTLLAWDPQRGWGFANTQTPQQQLTWWPDPLFQIRWNAMGRLAVEIQGPGKGNA